MKCPYNQKSLKHIEHTENQIIDDETGVCKGHCTTKKKKYEYCDCIKEDCAVYYDGKCHYNG